MSKRFRNYFKLVYTEYGYEIYAVENGKSTKLGKKAKIILYEVLRKFSYIKKNENTYIFTKYNLISLYYARACLNKKFKKVNRGKSKRVIAGFLILVTMVGAALGIKNAEWKRTDGSSNIPSTPVSVGVTIYEEEKNDDLVFVGNYTDGEVDIDTGFMSGNSTTDEVVEEDFLPEDEYVEEEILFEEDEVADITEFRYECDTPNDKEALDNSSKYMELFEKYERMYGVDAKLLCAIGAQESSGIHNSVSTNGGYATGLMGIENIWADQEIRVFNFDKNTYEIITVDYSKIGDLEYNIKVGAAIFQNYFYSTIRNNESISYDERLAFTVQKYNMGPGNMGTVLSYGGDWIGNRDMIDSGDSRYLEHVLSRLDNGTIIRIRLDDGSYFETKINNISLEKNNGHNNNI